MAATRTRAAGRQAVALAGALWAAAVVVFLSSHAFVQGGMPPSHLRGGVSGVRGHELEIRPLSEPAAQAGEAARMPGWASLAAAAAAFGLVIGMAAGPVRAEEEAAKPAAEVVAVAPAEAPAPAPAPAAEAPKPAEAPAPAPAPAAEAPKPVEAPAPAPAAEAPKLVEAPAPVSAAEAPKPVEAPAPAPAAESTETGDATKKKKFGKKTKKVVKAPKEEAEVKKEEPASGFSLPSFTPPEQPAAPEAPKFINPSDERDDDELTFDEWTAKYPAVLFAMLISLPATYLVFFVLGSLDII